MSHWSEHSNQLEMKVHRFSTVNDFQAMEFADPDVYCFQLPILRTVNDRESAVLVAKAICSLVEQLDERSVVAIFASPDDAAVITPHLEEKLRFQLWFAVKTIEGAYPPDLTALPRRHAAMLIFSKYPQMLKHTKTRIAYSFCPACGKTTKDYGGKKHTYHEFGTLLSDVWRDIEVDPRSDINLAFERLSDLLGLAPHKRIHIFDFRESKELVPQKLNRDSALGVEAIGELESRLVNGDVLETLAQIPDNSVDFCFADPPYNLRKKYDSWSDALEAVEYFNWCDAWLSELYRVLKPNRTIAVLNIPLWSARHFQHLMKIATFKSWIVWDALSFPVRMIMPAHYSIICFTKGDGRELPLYSRQKSVTALNESYCLRAGCVSNRNKVQVTDRVEITDLWHDLHRLKHNSRRVDHPCQLPPALMARLFEVFTHENEMILDCFNGAGTSTLVAEQMNRKYVGIELSADYHSLAEKRHVDLSSGVDPFAKADRKLSSKNSPVPRMQKQRYAVSKKTLQLDVRRIAKLLNRLPNRDEVIELSAYPIEYFDNYFVSWGEVCAAARTTGMQEDRRDPDKERMTLFDQIAHE